MLTLFDACSISLEFDFKKFIVEKNPIILHDKSMGENVLRYLSLPINVC